MSINRCHQCPDYPKDNPPAGHMCAIAGRQVFASTHACPAKHRIGGTKMPVRSTRWDPKAKTLTKTTAPKPPTTGTETPTMEPICVRLGCEDPALDGKKICQKHYDIVIAGQKKRTDIKPKATVFVPVGVSEPLSGDRVEFTVDEPVVDQAIPTDTIDEMMEPIERDLKERFPSKAPTWSEIGRDAEQDEPTHSPVTLRDLARDELTLALTKNHTKELIATLSRLAVAQLQNADLYDDTETIDVLDRIAELAS